LEKNFPGLHVTTKSCTDKDLDKIKDKQRKAKEDEGEERVFGQGSISDSGSISSSDEEELEGRATEGKSRKKGKLGKGVGALEDPRGAVKETWGDIREKSTHIGGGSTSGKSPDQNLPEQETPGRG
jgi:hypothetical protein